jgi:hypothetical protein
VAWSSMGSSDHQARWEVSGISNRLRARESFRLHQSSCCRSRQLLVVAPAYFHKGSSLDVVHGGPRVLSRKRARKSPEKVPRKGFTRRINPMDVFSEGHRIDRNLHSSGKIGAVSVSLRPILIYRTQPLEKLGGRAHSDH